jgi:pimeloyl-ACP methyl ester carboxylesterase
MTSPGPADHLVVLLHGLGRTPRSLARMDRALRDAGLSTLSLSYPSMRQSIEQHAATVAARLDAIATPKKLSFVTHSLGGLIVRRLFTIDASWRAAINRIVMLAPPNKGASLASTLDRGGVVRGIMGPSYVQIAEGYAETLPIPDVPFVIYAGDAPGVPGDGLLRVEETKLDGASEHHVVPVIHTFIMNHPTVIRGTTAFLAAAPD